MKKVALFLSLVWAQAVFSDTTSEALQTKLNAIRTMNASFSQVVSAKHREISRSSGTMALARPGRFRWDTKRPMAQLVLADGQQLWVYDVDLEQVSVRKQEKGLGGPAGLFLSDNSHTITQDFNVTASGHEDSMTFDLHAKSNKANFQRVKLVFVGDVLSGIELFDPLGQQTKVRLSRIQNNVPLSKDLFKFKPPKGVDVVKQ
jgi:outer membrane lipoprotein carrier protein